MVYYWGLFSRLAFIKKQGPANTNPLLPSVSLVVCARNEYTNLENNIPLLLAQDYPHFELVVVNDCSDDGSEVLLSDFARTDSRLKVVHLRQNLNFFHGKKFPLSMGIKSAQNEIILLTDADCKPSSNQWMKTIASHYNKYTEVVLGYSPYEKQKSLLNLFIRFDTLLIGMQYLSFALAGKPYMGVGRNLSYRKSLFLKNKGFTAHYNIPSGDDDLFIHQVAKKTNTAIDVSADAMVVSRPKTSFSAWLRQKRRHLSTGKYYKTGIKANLGLYALTQITFYISFIWLFFLAIPFYIPLALYALRLISQLIIFGKSSQKLGDKIPILFVPLAEIFFIIFNPLLVIINIFAKQVKWT